MLNLKNLSLVAATLLAVGTSNIEAASAIVLNFHLTSPLRPDLSYFQEDRLSLIISDFLSNNLTFSDLILRSGSDSLVFLQLNNGGGLGFGRILTSGMFPSWTFHSVNNHMLGSSLAPGVSMATGSLWRMSIDCRDKLINCVGSRGSLFLKLGYTSQFPVAYDGDIVVDSVSLTPNPTPTPNPTSVPEPSSVAALLLLGSIELLRRKLKVWTS